MKALALVAALLFATTPALADYFVPPGQEDLVAAMLGRGELIGPSCRLDLVDMQPTKIEGTYVCQGTAGLPAVRVTLAHPSASATPTAFTTREFAVGARAGAPEALLGALRERIVAREAAWHWVVASDAAASSRGGARWGYSWLPLAAACAAMLLVAAGAAVRARLRS